MGTFKGLRADEVTFTLTAEYEDIPVRGNALACGDDAEDKACEDEIIARLDRGDVWAWAYVTVTARWRDWKGSATLGACSCTDEDDFRTPGGYYDDMCAEALAELNVRVQTAFEALADRAEAVPS
jgi:hypothetical protein